MCRVTARDFSRGDATGAFNASFRRYHKSFKFPPGPTASEPAPPVPDVPKDLSANAQKPKSRVEEKRARKSKDSDEVAMVVPSSVEVPPPSPIEKERVTSSASDLDDVGETEEISLN